MTKDDETIIEALRAVFAKGTYLFTAHGSDRAAERGIASHEIEAAVANAEVIENYPEDKYGPSCLLMGRTETGRILHIHVSYPPKIKIITVYEPSPSEWDSSYKVRKK